MQSWQGIFHRPYCLWLLNTVPFCKNDAKLYFDAKDLRKRIEKRRGVGERLGVTFGIFFFFFKNSALSGQYQMLQ